MWVKERMNSPRFSGTGFVKLGVDKDSALWAGLDLCSSQLKRGGNGNQFEAMGSHWKQLREIINNG